MSITSILYGNTFDSLKDYIKMNAPKKDAFLSSTGYPAFSTSIPIQVVGSTHSTHETALVGEIADYAFCLEILRYVKNVLRTQEAKMNVLMKADYEKMM